MASVIKCTSHFHRAIESCLIKMVPGKLTQLQSCSINLVCSYRTILLFQIFSLPQILDKSGDLVHTPVATVSYSGGMNEYTTSTNSSMQFPGNTQVLHMYMLSFIPLVVLA